MWAAEMLLIDQEGNSEIKTRTFYTSMEYNELGVLMHLLNDEMDLEDLLG